MQLYDTLRAVVKLDVFSTEDLGGKLIRKSEATGFFYKDKETERIFLITNEHVVEKANELRFFVCTNGSFKIKNAKPIVLQPQDIEGKIKWKSPGRKVDVAALEVPQDCLEGCTYACFSEEDIPPGYGSWGNLSVPLGLRVLVLGYPFGFHDKEKLFPMARTATVATVPWENFERENYFLIDSHPLHAGMSGSPVILSSTAPVGNPKVSLVGVFSHEWTVSGEPFGFHVVEPLGLHIAWHAYMIKGIVRDIVVGR